MAAIRDRTKGFDRPEEEEPLSVAQQHLRQLLRRQLSTRTGSVESALHQSREFAPPVTFRQLASEVEGLHSLQQYQTKQEGHGRVDALRELGLTFEEIELKLSCEQLERDESLGPGAAKRMRVSVEPTAQQERIQALKEKISSREKLLRAPLKFKGAHQLSRHAMEVENSLFRYQGNPLTHLTVEDHKAHINYPSKVIPAASSSSRLPREEKDLEGEDEVAVVGGDMGCSDAAQDVTPLPLQVLERNRLTEVEIRAMPKFSSYSPGNPSKTLYLKNLHHAVTAEDLQAVFGHLQASHGLPVVRVMKGHLRGQAFIKFASVDGAEAGLKTVNGFVMRDKPVIISYGRVTKNIEET